MAIIHQTTMAPSKLELLASWLPAQPWFRGPGHSAELARAGGFRLDDPEGEVGIEFMAVASGSGDEAATYLVPLTYRGHPLEDSEAGLVGTAEHGVLGPRWIYDGIHDPVLIAQLVALIQGEAEPQAQTLSETPDRTVESRPVPGGARMVTGAALSASGAPGAELRIETDSANGKAGVLTVTIHRVLEPGALLAGQSGVTATWRLPSGDQARGVFATALSG